jgi:sirohydrochlorin ferrochelatase
MARTGVEEVVVVPLEIGCAWNPSEEARDAVERASAGLPDVRIQLSRPIGPEPTLLPLLDQALRQGLAEHHVTELDGLVLSTAGTSDVRSRAVLARRARQWGLHHKLSCVTAYADDSGPSVEEAIQTLWHQGRRHVAVGSWFLSASATWARQAEQALGHGATAVSRPIASAPDIATLVMQRYVVGAMDLVDFGDLLGDEADEPQLHAIGA